MASTITRVLFKSSGRLLGRTCVITGGSSGIGLAIAERFLQEGARKVILMGRSHQRLVNASHRLGCTPRLEEFAGKAGSGVATGSPEENRNNHLETGRPNNLVKKADAGDKQGELITASEKVSLLVGDVSSAGEWMRTLEKTMEEVDILVNAAGISVSSILPKTTPQDVSQILATNLEGAILTSRALLRACVRAGFSKNRRQPSPTDHNRERPLPPSKCIINISSLLALKGGTGAISYAASKAGLLGLTRAVAAEAASILKGVSVRSNAIIPGYIETPMTEEFSYEQASRLKESIPVRRFGDPQEVADAAVFLAHNEYANNCVLNLDGGLSAF